MATDGDALLAGTIANPRLWRLGMLLDTEAATLTVAATSIEGDETPLCREIRLADGVEPLRAIEDAVYDNPMLLADFARCDVLLRAPHYAVVPQAFADDPEAQAAAAALLWTDPDFRPSLLCDAVQRTEAAVLTAMDSDVMAFLGRTFADARVRNALSNELGYFAGKACSNRAAKVYVVAEHGGVDLFCFDGHRLLGAVRYACTEVADMTYYAAAMAQVCGVAGPDVQFYVGGAPDRRDAVAEELRRFSQRVMPWLLSPSATKAPGDMQLPFPLLILPICE
ncbi:MAG: DUF3822 family protein [Muribaculaceae bacterium]|nr:DUF3822 family protein [Muribaculaceae bacterium]